MSHADLALRLINTVEKELNEEAVMVRRRVAYALHYMEQVVTPNRHTLNHLRRILSGADDNMVQVMTEEENQS